MVLIAAWKRVVVERFADFTRRAGRAEFWWFALSNFIISAVLTVLGQVSTVFLIISVLYGLALIIPSIAVSVRRLHDINRTGWWILIGLIPLIGAIVLLVFHVIEGDAGSNRYGPPADPLPA